MWSSGGCLLNTEGHSYYDTIWVTLPVLFSCSVVLHKARVLFSCCVALYTCPQINWLLNGEKGGRCSWSHSGLCWEVVLVVICLVLVPGKLPGSVAGRRKNMSNVLKIVWLCLKTKTRLSLRNSRPSKIFIAIKQSNCV